MMNRKACMYAALLVLLSYSAAWAQPIDSLQITLIIQGAPESNGSFSALVQEEVNALMQSRRPASFNVKFTGETYESARKSVLEDDTMADIVVTLGILPSQAIAQRGSYDVPTIAGILLNPAYSGLRPTEDGTSGVPNLSYIISPFDVQSDIDLFYEIVPFKKLGILLDDEILSGTPILKTFLNQNITQCPCGVYPLGPGYDAERVRADSIDACMLCILRIVITRRLDSGSGT